jgi:hypothetical protein
VAYSEFLGPRVEVTDFRGLLCVCERWESPDRSSDPPYFGWLCSPILVYPSTIHLKLSVQSRAPGLYSVVHR